MKMETCFFCNSLLLFLKAIDSSSSNEATATTLATPLLHSLGPAPDNFDMHLRIMTYNIKQIPNYFGLHSWDQNRRREELIAAIKDMGKEAPDTLVFNELLSSSALTAIQRDLRDIYPYQTNVIGKDCATKEGWTTLSGNCQVFLPRGGVNIVSRFPIEEVHGLVYESKVKGTWDQLCNKGAVLAKIRVSANNVFWLLGTHLQSDEGGIDGAVTRTKQAEEFTKWVDINRASGVFNISSAEPVLIAGDLNVEFNNHREQYREMLRETKLTVNFSGSPVGSFSAKTNWLTKGDHYSRSRPLDYDDTLDYIGYRKDFRNAKYAPTQIVVPIKAETAWYWDYIKGWWDLPVMGWTWNNGYYKDISDHYPVYAEFYF